MGNPLHLPWHPMSPPSRWCLETTEGPWALYNFFRSIIVPFVFQSIEDKIFTLIFHLFLEGAKEFNCAEKP
jgi:hypothetical protein